jgi:hypothetical protein
MPVSAVPSVRFVGIVQVSVAEPVVPPLTVIVNAGSEALFVPSLTEIVTFANVPMFAVAGVPESLPVVALNVAQLGLFAIENVSVPPLGFVVVGVKL